MSREKRAKILRFEDIYLVFFWRTASSWRWVGIKTGNAYISTFREVMEQYALILSGFPSRRL